MRDSVGLEGSSRSSSNSCIARFQRMRECTCCTRNVCLGFRSADYGNRSMGYIQPLKPFSTPLLLERLTIDTRPCGSTMLPPLFLQGRAVKCLAEQGIQQRDNPPPYFHEVRRRWAVVRYPWLLVFEVMRCASAQLLLKVISRCFYTANHASAGVIICEQSLTCPPLTKSVDGYSCRNQIYISPLKLVPVLLLYCGFLSL